MYTCSIMRQPRTTSKPAVRAAGMDESGAGRTAVHETSLPALYLTSQRALQRAHKQKGLMSSAHQASR